MADKIVAPGEQIKPQIDLAGGVELAECLYGVTVESAQELVGYDDKNYHLKVKEPPNNKFISQLWPHGYVFKIMNSSDSKKLDYVEAQCELMIYSGNHGIRTTQPQRNINGQLYCIATLGNERKKYAEHVVRLLTYEDGTLMRAVPWTFVLHYEVGRYAAKLDLILKDFHHPAYNHYSSLWMLKNVSKIEDFLFVVKDEQRSSLVKDVLNAFENSVMSRFSSLKSGMIHGDIHDQNLVCKQDASGEWHISAVLDWGDAHYSAYVIELALSMAYMMLQSESVQSGSHVIAGYCSVHPLPSEELKLLKVCVCARLCQSLVLGLYTNAQDPNNLYVLTTQGPGWTLLQSLWSIDSAQLEDLWFDKVPLTSSSIL